MKADVRNDEAVQPGKDEADRGEDQVILMGETTTSRVNIYSDLKDPHSPGPRSNYGATSERQVYERRARGEQPAKTSRQRSMANRQPVGGERGDDIGAHLTMKRQAIAFLVQQQMVEEAIGFVGGMDSRKNATAALAAIGTAEGLLDGWTVPGGTLPNQV